MLTCRYLLKVRSRVSCSSDVRRSARLLRCEVFGFNNAGSGSSGGLFRTSRLTAGWRACELRFDARVPPKRVASHTSISDRRQPITRSVSSVGSGKPVVRRRRHSVGLLMRSSRHTSLGRKNCRASVDAWLLFVDSRAHARASSNAFAAVGFGSHAGLGSPAKQVLEDKLSGRAIELSPLCGASATAISTSLRDEIAEGAPFND